MIMMFTTFMIVQLRTYRMKNIKQAGKYNKLRRANSL